MAYSQESSRTLTFKSQEVKLQELLQVARLYNQVFSGQPWFEGVFCDECGAMKSPTVESIDARPCHICNHPRISISQRVDKISEDFIHKDFLIALAKNDIADVIGYAYGFTIDSPVDFVNDKYTTNETRLAIKESIESFGIRAQFYYFSDIGIYLQYRDQGLSNFLSKAIDDYAKQLKLPGITRTLYDSPLVNAERKLGFEIIAGPDVFPIADKENSKRVLLARK